MPEDFVQAELARARQEAADFRTKARDAERERDEALKKLNEAESSVQQLQVRVGELEPLQDRLKESGKKYDALVKTRRDEILARIPEDKREKYKDFDVEQLRVVAEDISAEEKPSSPAAGSQVPAAPGAETPASNSLDLRTMSPQQLEDLRRTDFAAYSDLLDKSVSANPSLSNTFG